MTMYRPHRLCPKENKPKEPSLYRSLCISILSMFLSTVMLVGTTMAWFSDSLQTGLYTITSADFSTTVYYCTDLSNAEYTPNNWQRLNPGNTTMFGGGSLSGSNCQTAYLKIVNASGIDLKYTLSITGETTGKESSITLLSLAYKEVDNEADLKTAFTSTQNGENTFTDASTPITVPANSTKFVALKLSLNAAPTESTNQEQPATPYKFGLCLKIMQTQPNAQAGEPESPVTMDVDMTIIGDTASNLNTTNATNDGNSQPVEAATGDGDENPSGSASEPENNTELSEPDTSGNVTSNNDNIPVIENESET